MQEKRMHENRVSLPTIATLCNSSTEVVALLGTMLFSTRHSKIFPFDTPKNMAWELFGFGAESKKFSRHNEKNLVPFFQKIFPQRAKNGRMEQMNCDTVSLAF